MPSKTLGDYLGGVEFTLQRIVPFADSRTIYFDRSSPSVTVPRATASLAGFTSRTSRAAFSAVRASTRLSWLPVSSSFAILSVFHDFPPIKF